MLPQIGPQRCQTGKFYPFLQPRVSSHGASLPLGATRPATCRQSSHGCLSEDPARASGDLVSTPETETLSGRKMLEFATP